MLDITPTQVDALTLDALRLYAECLERWKKGEAVFEPANSGRRVPTVYAHLKALDAAGVATFRKVGRGRYEFSPIDRDRGAFLAGLLAQLQGLGYVERFPALNQGLLLSLRSVYTGGDAEFQTKLLEIFATCDGKDISNLGAYLRAGLSRAPAAGPGRSGAGVGSADDDAEAPSETAKQLRLYLERKRVRDQRRQQDALPLPG